MLRAMYELLLYAHSYLRWVVLIAGVIAVAMAFRATRAKTPWTAGDRKAQLAYTVSLDVQFTVGLLLYVVSPLVRSGLANMAGAMKTSAIRFFVVEHLVMMIAALAVAHIFGARSKRMPDDVDRHKSWFMGALISLILVLVSIPWPFWAFGRPLFRF